VEAAERARPPEQAEAQQWSERARALRGQEPVGASEPAPSSEPVREPGREEEGLARAVRERAQQAAREPAPERRMALVQGCSASVLRPENPLSAELARQRAAQSRVQEGWKANRARISTSLEA